MPSYRTLLMIVGSLPLLVAVGSYVAGEQVEVAILRTFAADGHGHDTKLWVVDHEGQPWLRGAQAHLSWLERIRHNPRVELVRGGVTLPYVASIEQTPEVKRKIDEAMAAKYGWIDHWYEILIRPDPIPIRLDPAPGAS
jgi:general stress protein 26